MQYIFIHGSWHGSWCWQKLVPHLQKKGHQTECLDLPGNNSIEEAGKVTYQDYCDYVEQAILRHNEPITLVAHSMGGIIAAPLADRHHERVQHTFFVAAMIPDYNTSLIDIVMRYDNPKFGMALHEDEVHHVNYLDKNLAKELLYQDCPPELQQWAADQLRWQSVLPIQTPIPWKDTNSSKRTYIHCTKDRALVPQAQLDILKAHPCKVVQLESSHSPFLSSPERIAEVLSI